MTHLDVSENYFEDGRHPCVMCGAPHDGMLGGKWYCYSCAGGEPDWRSAANGYQYQEDGWLYNAAGLLAEPDPGPTPWLVEGLIVDRAIVAAVGRWKTTKSYGLLDICISIAVGEPAFGRLPVTQGRVVFINEESGRTALRRRLDALCRGRAIDPERLRGQLYVAANERIRLDGPDWQARITDDCGGLDPSLIVFDPLARMKSPDRVENDQTGMAPLIEYLRQLRDDLDTTVCFVHHTGHQGDHMRGSSDLESAWETRLQWKRDGQSPIVTIESEHREAEAGDPLQYKIGWDAQTRSMRFDAVVDTTLARVAAHLRDHPDDSGNKVFEAVGGTRAEVLANVKSLREQGGTEPSYHPRTTTPEAPLAGGTRGASLEALVPPTPEPGTETSYHHPNDEVVTASQLVATLNEIVASS